MRYLFYLIVVVFLGSFFTGFARIGSGERAVVRRFGRVIDTPGPGLWIGLPWGLDKVDRVSVQIRNLTVGYDPNADESSLATPAGQVLTGDHNLVNVQAIVQYAVDDDHVVEFVEQQDRANDLIARAAESVLAEWVAGRGIDDVLLQGKIQLPQALVTRTQERLQPYHLGVRIEAANVSHLFPPAQVKDAFDKVTQAQAEIRTKEQNALREANDIRRQAQREKFEIENRTQAYVNEKLRLAQADADRFEKRLAQYHRLRSSNPHFLEGIWWDEMGRLFAKLKDTGRVDMLDNHLGADGLDISVFPPMPGKKNK